MFLISKGQLGHDLYKYSKLCKVYVVIIISDII